MSRFKRIGLCLLLLTVLASGVVSAKGPPDKVTVNGPGLSDEVEISDKQILQPVAMGEFVDFETEVNPPGELEAGYEITRWYRIGGSSLVKAIDHFVYYPDPGGSRGYIFYTGIVDKTFIYGGSPYDNKWFRVREEGEQAFLEVLAERGVSFDVNPSWVQLPNDISSWLGYGSLLVIAGTIFILVYRRRVSQQPSI